MSTIITPSPLPEGLNGPLHPYVALLEAFLKEEGRLDKLDAAVEGAVDEGISELEDWKISTGEQFFQYASRLLDKWIPSEIQDGTFVYQVITVFYCEFTPSLLSIGTSSDIHETDIFDQAELNDLQTKIVPQSIDQHGLPILTPLSQWIVGYANLMGEWLDQPRSITPDSYQSFRDAKKYRIGDYRIPIPGDPVGGFQSFNEFFCRHLKEGWPYPNVRHIEKLDDPNVVIFPADSVFDNHWGINDENLVSIKNLPWPIGALLHGCPGAYVDRFEGGTWCHAFLNTFDYHRQHAPVAGRVSTQRSISFIDVSARFLLELFDVGFVELSLSIDPPAISVHSRRPDSNADEFIDTTRKRHPGSLPPRGSQRHSRW